MRILSKVGNIWWGENSSQITSEETTRENTSPISADTYDLTYHAKQLGKGLLIFGAGLLGYVGFSVFFGNRRAADILETGREVDGKLAFPKVSLLNMQSKISGTPTFLNHQKSKEFVPTSFSTSRTLLSLQEKEKAKDDVEMSYRSINSAKNNAPKLLNNKLTVKRGETVILTSDMLSATDIDSDDATLTFTVNNVQRGRFNIIEYPGKSIDFFIQQNISDKMISFVHDGSTVRPDYEIKVSDGVLETIFVPASVTFYLTTLDLMIVGGSLLGGLCFFLTVSVIMPAPAILFILWVARQKQSKSEQETELKKISDVTEKQVGSEHKKSTVTLTQQSFFQLPRINDVQNNSGIELVEALNSEDELSSTSEDSSEECELTFVTSEEVMLKSCNNLVGTQSTLLAWGKKYSGSNDTLLVYQQDTKEWFICGKNSEKSVSNEKISSSSILGKMLTSKNREEIAKIDLEKLQNTALDYLGYEDESTEEDPSAEDNQPRVSAEASTRSYQ